MNKFVYYLKALRAPFFTASIIPVILGGVLAWSSGGQWNLQNLLLTILMAISVQGSINLANDYFDHKSGNDEANANFSQFNGGSRVIQEGLLKPTEIMNFSLLLMIVSTSISFYLNLLHPGNTLLLISFLGLAIGFFYTAGPIKLSYRGFGELAVGICFGPLLVNYSYYVFTGTFSLSSILLSIPIGILVSLILLVNEFPDYEADSKTKKYTLVVIAGRKKSKSMYLGFLIMIYASLILSVVFSKVTYLVLLGLLSSIIGIKAYSILSKNYLSPKNLLPANGMTIGLHLITGVLIIAGIVIDKLIF